MTKYLICIFMCSGIWASDSAFFFGGHMSSRLHDGAPMAVIDPSELEKHIGFSIGGRTRMTRYLSLGFESYVQIKYDQETFNQSWQKYQHMLLFDLKPTWHLSDALHLFGSVGYNPRERQVNETNLMVGLRVGAGAEAFISDSMSMVLQYVQTQQQYDDQDKGLISIPTVTFGAHIYC